MNVCPACSYRGSEAACPRDGFPLVDEHLFTDSSREPDLQGKVFDNRYEVDSLIGRGGMGWVFKAKHLTMQHDVALKLLRRDVAQDMSAVKRFYQEARTCAQLKHPNTIKVHDFGASKDGYLFLAMEFLVGEPLGRVLRRDGPLPVERTIRIARQICESLDEAHEQGMVHRDLKPDNVFLTEVHRKRDFVKVLDFGIAKVVHEGGEAAETLTSTGLVVGTPKYMSPEQAQAKPLDGRSDLYSLGVILHEMLTGELPFRAPSPASLLVQHITVAPPPLPETVRGRPLPAGLRALVAELLAKRPEDRPESAANVDDRLEAILAGGVAAEAAVDADEEPPGRGAGPGTGTLRDVVAPFGVSGAREDDSEYGVTRVIGRPVVAPEVTSAEVRAVSLRRRWPWALVGVALLAGVAFAVTMRNSGPTGGEGPSQPASEVGHDEVTEGVPPVLGPKSTATGDPARGESVKVDRSPDEEAVPEPTTDTDAASAAAPAGPDASAGPSREGATAAVGNAGDQAAPAGSAPEPAPAEVDPKVEHDPAPTVVVEPTAAGVAPTELDPVPGSDDSRTNTPKRGKTPPKRGKIPPKAGTKAPSAPADKGGKLVIPFGI